MLTCTMFGSSRNLYHNLGPIRSNAMYLPYLRMHIVYLYVTLYVLEYFSQLKLYFYELNLKFALLISKHFRTSYKLENFNVIYLRNNILDRTLSKYRKKIPTENFVCRR